MLEAAPARCTLPRFYSSDDPPFGIDWLGQVVEKIGGRRIDKYCQDEIFDPLGMSDTAFAARGHRSQPFAHRIGRFEDGKFAPFDIAPPANPEVYGMGHALYSTAPDYMRFLRMFLNRGALDGKRLLSESSLEWMLADHMNGLTFTHPLRSGSGRNCESFAFPETDRNRQSRMGWQSSSCAISPTRSRIGHHGIEKRRFQAGQYGRMPGH